MATRKTIVDLTGIQEADDGNNCYYGGTWKVGPTNGATVEGVGRGSDRDDGFWIELYDAMAEDLAVTRDDIADLVVNGDDEFCAGNRYEVTATDLDGNLSMKYKKVARGKPARPSRKEATKWLRAMGIEFKMVNGKPVVKLTDKKRILKIFSE